MGRTVAGALALAVVLALAGAAAAGSWDRYRERFVAADGRVIDQEQAQTSHSEGQAYGLLLALAHGDRPTFDRVWRWTRDNLAVRRDGLLAWSWGRRATGAWEVIDYNSATDGDLLVAYALLGAAERWGEPAYREAALPLIRALRQHLGFAWDGLSLLLPGHFGFARADAILWNPSYAVLPAYRAFAAADDRAYWGAAAEGAAALLGRLGREGPALAPDWVALGPSGAARPDPERGRWHGDEAVRVSLYNGADPAYRVPPGEARLLELVDRLGHLPRRVELVAPGVSLEEAPAGHYAARARAAEALGRGDQAARLRARAAALLAPETEAYYSFSLYLLAESELFRRGP